MRVSEMRVSFSTNFIAHVGLLYRLALDQMKSGKVVVHGINSYTHLAGPAYISAVAAVEAFLNELVFGPNTEMLIPDSALWQLGQGWIERISISKKLLLVPELLFRQTLERDKQPYQDFDILTKVRNDFVHYKMKGKAPVYVKDLAQRSIALTASPEGPDYAWVHKLSSSEGIRWAHNTACETVHALVSVIPEGYRSSLAVLAESFVEIDSSVAKTAQSRFRRTDDK
jgi:hypothetical protein